MIGVMWRCCDRASYKVYSAHCIVHHASFVVQLPGDRTKSRYRRFSAVVGGAVSAMAKVLGITTARMAAAELHERLDTTRILQDSIDIKVFWLMADGWA